MSHAISLHDHPALAESNITLAPDRVRGVTGALLAAGGIAMIATVALGVMGKLEQALIGYLIGAVLCVGLGLGGLFWCLVLAMFDSGWTATVKRQFENLATMIPVGVGLFVVFLAAEMAVGGKVCSFFIEAYTKDDFLYNHKQGYFQLHWVLLRLVAYVAVWMWLLRQVVGRSFEQDRTGDKWLSAKQRVHASYGLLLFAFSLAFFSFDWLKAVADYRFFSTMWGVYFFAGNALASACLVAFVLMRLQSAGKLQHGAITAEHRHDLAKIIFAFTVFWAYIAYSQYFLIWYSNIPEETHFFIFRKTHWPVLSATLVFGHFVVPWYFLLWRGIRRSVGGLTVLALYMLLMHVLDIYWILRPVIEQGLADRVGGEPAPIGLAQVWMDPIAIAGPVLVFLGLLARQIASRPLLAKHDPRMAEALAHKNYV